MPLPAETDQPLAHLRNDDELHGNDAGRNQTKPEALQNDEDQRCQRLPAEQRRLHEGIADEAAERLHLILDHRRDFRRLDALEMPGREAQDLIDQLEADAAQHALAKPALVGVDIELEETVDDDQRQENQTQADERLCAVEVETVEEVNRAVERNVDIDRQEGLGCTRRFESLALDRSVDDLLGQIEGHEIRDHRHSDDEDDP